MMLNKVIHKFRTIKTTYELSLLKKRAERAGYEFKRIEPLPVSEILVENYFKTHHKKNALLSYVICPFLGEVENNHSNNKECFTIAEILNEIGYNVDVINWDNTTYL